MVQSNFTKTRVVVKFMKMINRFIGCLFKKYEIKIVNEFLEGSCKNLKLLSLGKYQYYMKLLQHKKYLKKYICKSVKNCSI